MFLSLIQRRNPGLLAAAVDLHQAGQIPANCTVIDLDAVERNAGAINREARRLGMLPLAMTKQIGRNPDASRAIAAGGITHHVGVDLQCAIAACAGGLLAGHVGHLVQIPRSEAHVAAALEPLYWTVFNDTKAHEAGAAAVRRGRIQDVLARIQAPGDRVYRGHEGGFDASDILSVADRIDRVPGLRFAGVTSFPATLFNPATQRAESTPNLGTLTRALHELERAGRTNVQLNAPGTTSTAMLATLAAAGATQVEPGHGLTGTTPLHAVTDLVEEPAITYVSEVSHRWNDEAFIFGGGLYVDPVLGSTPTRALVVPRGAGLSDARDVPVMMPAPGAIDYYATIPLGGQSIEVGDTVLFGFRPQVFVSRSLTAGISGITTGRPLVHRVWSADGSAPLGLDDAIHGLGTRK